MPFVGQSPVDDPDLHRFLGGHEVFERLGRLPSPEPLGVRRIRGSGAWPLRMVRIGVERAVSRLMIHVSPGSGVPVALLRDYAPVSSHCLTPSRFASSHSRFNSIRSSDC